MSNSIIKPSEQCKTAGLKSLMELSTISGVSNQTLINWHKEKPHLFEIVLAGSIVKKQNKEKPISEIQGYPVQTGNITND